MSFGGRPKEIACTKCEEVQPLDEEHFYLRKHFKYGFTRQCKICLRKIAARQARKNPHRNKRAWKSSGMSYSQEYMIYQMAKQRCTNPKSQRWYTHGARGIKFLFKSFEEFYAELGPKPKGLSLERVDNDGNYEPGNVMWANRSAQQKNKRFYGKGYSFDKSTGKWQAKIRYDGKEIYIGLFAKEKDAQRAVKELRKNLLREREATLGIR